MLKSIQSRLYIGILAVAFVSISSWQNSAAAEITWEEEPQFHVEVNGKIDITGKVYRPSDNRALLLFISGNFTSPLLIDLSKKTISAVANGKLSVRDEYSYTSTGVPSARNVGKYALKSGASVFKYKGKTVSIKVRESLTGEVSEGIILAHSPVYAALRDSYKPNAKYVNVIKKHSKPVEVVVMFATWCPTCKQVLPRFMKVMDAAANDNLSIKYIGIAMGGSEPRAELEKYGHDYPAFIFFKNGKEVDRIIGEPNLSMEQTIAEILTRR